MNTIIIPTTQNIELEYPVANPGDRIFAGMIDVGIISLYSWVWYLILDSYQSYDDLAGYAGDVMYQLAMLPALTYSLWTESWLRGQTIGKRIMNLKTIRLDGAAAGMGEYAIRWILRIVDIWLSAMVAMPGLVAVITLISGKKGQRLGDMAAGTSVVKLKLVADFTDTIFVETEENYQVSFPAVNKLSDRDISILKEVMDAGSKQQNEALLQRLADRVMKVTGITTEMKPAQFLATVLKDYNFLYRD